MEGGEGRKEGGKKPWSKKGRKGSGERERKKKEGGTHSLSHTQLRTKKEIAEGEKNILHC